MMHHRIHEIDDVDVALVTTRAVEIVLQKRIEQVRIHGHDSAADDVAGPHDLIANARRRLRDAFREADLLQSEALDMTIGDLRRTDGHRRDVLLNRLATSAALVIAAMEAIQRLAAHPDKEHGR